MFKKKTCTKCKKKIENRYEFCPYCGHKIFSSEEDWGMIGKNDFSQPTNEIRLPAGFNTLFNSLIRNLSKEFDEQLRSNYFRGKKTEKRKKDGVSISISTFGNNPPRIKVSQLGNNSQSKTNKREKIRLNTFTKEKIKKFSKLPKEEPPTNIRRLANKVIYELEMPNIKSKEDISIIKLENSIEIKALSKDKAYVKRIPINLPIKRYDISNGKLVLELGIKN